MENLILYQEYSMDILFQSVRGPWSLESLAVPSGPVATALFAHHALPLLCAAPQSQPPTGPPDAVCPAQTATAIV